MTTGAQRIRDAVDANLRHSRDWMIGWSHSDGEILASRRPSPGRQASVSGGSRVRETDPVGGPMAGNFLASARTRRISRPAAATASTCFGVGACGQGNVSKTDSGVYRGSDLKFEHFAQNHRV